MSDAELEARDFLLFAHLLLDAGWKPRLNVPNLVDAPSDSDGDECRQVQRELWEAMRGLLAEH